MRTQRKIAVEEHFAVAETAENPRGKFPAGAWLTLKAHLLDIHDIRLRRMDDNGIEMMVLSLNSPVVQAMHRTREAIDMARRANDFLAEQIARRPDRFQGMGALPMQDPEAAAGELERCIVDLGFRGVLVNGFTETEDSDGPTYYDLPRYRPFWAAVESLAVPFYLHPRAPLAADARAYAGHPWLVGATWGFGNETALHALRLIGSGLFDEHPGLSIVIGHMGEGLPGNLWRIDNANAWAGIDNRYPARRKIADYFAENFYVTTSGHFSSSALMNALRVIGFDRVLFAVDWPYEEIRHAAEWLDGVDLSASDLDKIGRCNAARLFRLNGAPAGDTRQ